MTQMTKEQIAAEVQKHGSQAKAAKALGISPSSVSDLLRGATEFIKAKSPSGQTSQVGRSITEFKESHDKSYIVPKKIKAALAALGGGWEYEMPFAKLAGVSLGDLSAYRAMFEDHIVMVEKSKRAWAGTRLTADKMREMVN